jgi:hypothetical protein
MKNARKVSTFATATLLATSLLTSVYATDNNESSAIYAAAFDGCTLVEQIKLDEEAAQAYRDIKSLERRINAVHLPLDGVERTLTAYADEMKEISNLAIQDDGRMLYIDTELLTDQLTIAGKITALVALHQDDFDALSQIGIEAGEQAEAFSAPIEAAFDGLKYDQVKVFFEGEFGFPERCQ